VKTVKCINGCKANNDTYKTAKNTFDMTANSFAIEFAHDQHLWGNMGLNQLTNYCTRVKVVMNCANLCVDISRDMDSGGVSPLLRGRASYDCNTNVLL